MSRSSRWLRVVGLALALCGCGSISPLAPAPTEDARQPDAAPVMTGGTAGVTGSGGMSGGDPAGPMSAVEGSLDGAAWTELAAPISNQQYQLVTLSGTARYVRLRLSDASAQFSAFGNSEVAMFVATPSAATTTAVEPASRAGHQRPRC